MPTSLHGFVLHFVVNSAFPLCKICRAVDTCMRYRNWRHRLFSSIPPLSSLLILYLIWSRWIDDAPEKGRRWFRSSRFWKYFADVLPCLVSHASRFCTANIQCFWTIWNRFHKSLHLLVEANPSPGFSRVRSFFSMAVSLFIHGFDQIATTRDIPEHHRRRTLLSKDCYSSWYHMVCISLTSSVDQLHLPTFGSTYYIWTCSEYLETFRSSHLKIILSKSHPWFLKGRLCGVSYERP